jgi:tetratricopeptide (TPR) repeat protein
MPRSEATPSPQEIEQQLRRMLMNPVFTEAATQAQLLEYLVKKTLSGEAVTEKTILADLFPFYGREAGGRGKKPSSIVRVFKQKLLERLDEYYDGDGAGELVLIALLSKPRRKGYKPPPGAAYRTVFRYNPEHPVDQDYRRGLYHLDQCAPADDAIALDYFDSALDQKSDYAPSHLAIAEVHLRRAMYYHVQFTPSQSLKKAEKALAKALAANEGTWRAHAIAGMLDCFQGRFDQAQLSFDRAVALDGNETRYGAWYYAGFLMATGRTEEGMSLAQETARLWPDDLFAQVTYGIFLYLARRFDEALMALSLAEAMNAKHWLIRLASTLLALARSEPAAAYVILVHHLVGDDIFPGLVTFSLAEILRLRANPEQWGPGRKNATDPLFNSVYAALDDLIDKLPSPPKQLAQLTALSKQRYIAPFQLALAHMAVGDNQSAIARLQESVSEHYPVMAWLNILPLFDALR